jgi:hypothetical protein
MDEAVKNGEAAKMEEKAKGGETGNPVTQPTPTPEEIAAMNSAAMMNVLMSSLPVLAPMYFEMRTKELDAAKTKGEQEATLWGKALKYEVFFISSVLISGFGATAALAFTGQVASAEKIAFALFGFIGGRGFLHIRGLISSTSKRD